MYFIQIQIFLKVLKKIIQFNIVIRIDNVLVEAEAEAAKKCETVCIYWPKCINGYITKQIQREISVEAMHEGTLTGKKNYI